MTGSFISRARVDTGDRSPTPGLPPPEHRLAGPLSAVLAPSLWVRQTGASAVLHAVLLSRLPDVDGFGGVFLDDAISPPVSLFDADPQHMAIVHPLRLETEHDTPVCGVGLVDPSGRLAFSGRLRGRGLRPVVCRRFCFASHALLLKRPMSASKRLSA